MATVQKFDFISDKIKRANILLGNVFLTTVRQP
jgi:hypothetical protein